MYLKIEKVKFIKKILLYYYLLVMFKGSYGMRLFIYNFIYINLMW